MNREAEKEEEALPDRHEVLKFLGLKRGHIVAELGCGKGEWTVAAAAIVGGKGRVHAFARSDRDLRRIEEKIRRWSIDNISTYLEDAHSIALDDAVADFLIIKEDECGAPSASLLAEIIRISKPDGRTCFFAKTPGGLDLLSKGLIARSYLVEKKTHPAENCYILSILAYESVLNSKIERVAVKLGEELLGLSENEMRRAVFAERLGRAKAEVVAGLLNFIYTRATRKASPYLEMLESCLDIDRLRDVLGLEKMSQIYTVAREKGYEGLVRLLMNPRPKGKKHSKYDFVEGRDITDITLGEKRSLAKGLSKDTLDRLLYDEDPVVIGNLLKNPRLTEQEILKIASRRPVRQEILRVIFESEKWISRYVVKRALVLNPCTATGIALGLLHFLHEKDLKIVLSSGALHDEIRAGARELLEKTS